MEGLRGDMSPKKGESFHVEKTIIPGSDDGRFVIVFSDGIKSAVVTLKGPDGDIAGTSTHNGANINFTPDSSLVDGDYTLQVRDAVSVKDEKLASYDYQFKGAAGTGLSGDHYNEALPATPGDKPAADNLETKDRPIKKPT